MFNLLRMDFYRIIRSRSLYVCTGIFILTTISVYGLLWLMAVPKGQETALRIGMLAIGELKTASNILNDTDTLILFRQINLDGGLYNVVFGVWVMLFICTDYQSGFIKNIMAFHSNRWIYVGSKILTAGMVNIFFLVTQYGVVLLLNYLFHTMVPYAKIGDILFYLAWVWLLTTAFSALIMLICVCTKSVAAGSLAAVLFGGGLIVVPLYQLMHLFHMGDWLKYSIYLSISYGPNCYASLQDLQIFIKGIIFLILYSTATGIVLKKQDI